MLRAAFLVLLLVAAPLRAADLMDEGFRAAQAGALSQAASALREIGLRAGAGSGPLADLLRRRQAAAEALRTAEADLGSLAGGERLARAGEADGLRAEVRTYDAKLAADFPDYRALARPEPLGIAEVQALLHPGEAMVFLYTGAEASYVWAISPRAAAWHRVEAGQELLTETIAKLRRGFGGPEATRSAVALDEEVGTRLHGLAYNRPLAWRLYDVLLGPVAPVFRDAPQLFVVADGPLLGLPFAMLLVDPPEGEDDDPAALRASHWLIRDHALTLLPSVESLAVIRRLPAPAPGRQAFLGFGDPDLRGTAAPGAISRGLLDGGTADVGRLRELAPLPGTARELVTIARTLGAPASAVVTGDAATETAVKAADLSHAAVLAFATHGLLSGELRGLAEPALVLTPPAVPSRVDDGLLTASEIAELKLDADWVVPSACNTAGGDGRPEAEGLSGLARAFLFAGARAILVSNWPVRDDAAMRLTTGAFAALASGQAKTRAEALRLSMLALIDDASDPSLAHPAAWAPFVLVGEGD